MVLVPDREVRQVQPGVSISRNTDTPETSLVSYLYEDKRCEFLEKMAWMSTVFLLWIHSKWSGSKRKFGETKKVIGRQWGHGIDVVMLHRIETCMIHNICFHGSLLLSAKSMVETGGVYEKFLGMELVELNGFKVYKRVIYEAMEDKKKGNFGECHIQVCSFASRWVRSL